MTGEHTHHGKWSDRGVPHKGWNCVGIEDLGEPSQMCEMCESVEIRYVHHMEHDDWTGGLAVGCVCAENMENDYVRPRQREKRLKSAARRRRTWPSRKWRTSFKGNPYLNTEGYNITVFPAKDRTKEWRIRVQNRETGEERAGNKLYDSGYEAKLAALDALLWAKDHLR